MKIIKILLELAALKIYAWHLRNLNKRLDRRIKRKIRKARDLRRKMTEEAQDQGFYE